MHAETTRDAIAYTLVLDDPASDAEHWYARRSIAHWRFFVELAEELPGDFPLELDLRCRSRVEPFA